MTVRRLTDARLFFQLVRTTNDCARWRNIHGAVCLRLDASGLLPALLCREQQTYRKNCFQQMHIDGWCTHTFDVHACSASERMMFSTTTENIHELHEKTSHIRMISSSSTWAFGTPAMSVQENKKDVKSATTDELVLSQHSSCCHTQASQQHTYCSSERCFAEPSGVALALSNCLSSWGAIRAPPLLRCRGKVVSLTIP